MIVETNSKEFHLIINPTKTYLKGVQEVQEQKTYQEWSFFK